MDINVIKQECKTGLILRKSAFIKWLSVIDEQGTQNDWRH